VWASAILWVKQSDGSHVLRPIWLASFIVLPALVLVGEYLYLRTRVRVSPRRHRWRVAATLGLLALLVAIVGAGVAWGHYRWIPHTAWLVVDALRVPATLAFVLVPLAVSALLLLARRLTRPPGR
jgi:hypothetical protein